MAGRIGFIFTSPHHEDTRTRRRRKRVGLRASCHGTDRAAARSDRRHGHVPPRLVGALRRARPHRRAATKAVEQIDAKCPQPVIVSIGGCIGCAVQTSDTAVDTILGEEYGL